MRRGHRLTPEQRNKVVAIIHGMRGDDPEVSLRAISDKAGVSHVTVKALMRKYPAPADAVPAAQVDVLPAAAGHVRARASVRTQAEGADWLEHARGFLEVLRQLAESPTSSATERRQAAEHGAELALSAFELTAELREQEAAT